jgi:hypothetical protein
MAENPNAFSAAKEKQNVCSKIKRRTVSIRAFLNKQVTNLYSQTNVKFVYLQLRKIIELIEPHPDDSLHLPVPEEMRRRKVKVIATLMTSLSK